MTPLLLFLLFLPVLEIEGGSGNSYAVLPALLEVSYVHSSERYEVKELLLAVPNCIYILSSNLRYGPGASSSSADEGRLRGGVCLGRELRLNLAQADQPILKVNGRELPERVIVVRVRWLSPWEMVIRALTSQFLGTWS